VLNKSFQSSTMKTTHRAGQATIYPTDLDDLYKIYEDHMLLKSNAKTPTRLDIWIH